MAMKGVAIFALAWTTVAHMNIGGSGTPDLTTLFANDSNAAFTGSSGLPTTVTSPLTVAASFAAAVHTGQHTVDIDGPPTPTGTSCTNTTTARSSRPASSLAVTKTTPITAMGISGTGTGGRGMPNVTTTGRPVLGRGDANGVSVSIHTNTAYCISLKTNEIIRSACSSYLLP